MIQADAGSSNTPRRWHVIGSPAGYPDSTGLARLDLSLHMDQDRGLRAPPTDNSHTARGREFLSRDVSGGKVSDHRDPEMSGIQTKDHILE